jgi:hypothetical protein
VAARRDARTPTLARGSLWGRLSAGGTDGNEELTAVTAVVLLLLLVAIGVTIIRVQQLIDIHMFLGMLLLGPVVLKMASTGYRFTRYYTHSPSYVRKGPPELVLRLTAPIVVLSTIAVFATGVVLLVVGQSARHPFGMLHKLSFIVWVAFMALHVLAHLPEIPGALRATSRPRERPWDDQGAGRGSRAVLLAGSIVLGTALAIAVIPLFAAWGAGAPHIVVK